MTRPTRAMLLAAGLGTRMRPLTDTTAKPLLPLGGKPLLDHALDRLAEAGVQLVVVNVHWRADRIGAHLRERAARGLPPETVMQHEETLLDTGGAVHAALPLLGPEPLFVVNGDAFWLDGPRTALGRLSGAFDPAEHDAVLLLQRTFQVHAEVGFGDFALDKWGRPRRRAEREIVPYIFAGVQLVAPRLFEAAPPAPFSTNRVWDRAIERGRLRAVVHDGLWFHLSTPPDLAEAEALLNAGATGDTR
ncbi:MAG: nucleotidyltransferase family protein [Acetobacteraceae bacterium]|nr:nucleotidyltransferase family protein [Acetobacteraceae bacterium]